MRSGILVSLTVVVLCAFAATAESAQVIYVDDDAVEGGNGSSWQTACRYLQDALVLAGAAAKPVEIHVAVGIYKPDQGAGITPGDRAANFQLLNGVTLKGGYAGITASDPNGRDPGLYETLLNGDLAGNDNNNDPGSGRDDSCHVVIGSLTDNTAVMDGVKITGSMWLWLAPPCRFGPGSTARVFIDAGSPTIRNCQFVAGGHGISDATVYLSKASAPTFTGCVFRDNHTGMCSMSSSPTVSNCLFTGNTWRAVECDEGGAPSFTDCRFESNHTGVDGSGDISLMFTGCAFVDNSTAVSAGTRTVSATDCIFESNRRAVQVYSGSLGLTRCRFSGNTSGALSTSGDTSLTRCSFTDNSGGLAAGIWAHGSVTASDCTFLDNSAGVVGAILGGDLLTLRNCEFSGNAGSRIGAVDMGGGVLQATGCLFTGNSGERTGALSSDAAVFSLSNCTFADNRGSTNAIRYDKPGPACPAVVTQCIIWDGPTVVLEETPEAGPVTISYCDVQGGYPGEGNFDADPCFVTLGFWADPNDPSIVLGRQDVNAVWVRGDYHLKSQAGHWDQETADWVLDEITSPCIDGGDPNSPIGAEPFPNGGVANIGAYGRTAEASRSYFGKPVCETQIAGDINGDCIVNDTDMAILTSHLLMEGWPASDLPPTVVITEPQEGDGFHDTTPFNIRADAADADGVVIQVAFRMEYRSGTMSVGSGFTDADSSDGWGRQWRWPKYAATEPETVWTIWAEAMDNDGNITISPKIQVTRYVTN